MSHVVTFILLFLPDTNSSSVSNPTGYINREDVLNFLFQGPPGRDGRDGRDGMDGRGTCTVDLNLMSKKHDFLIPL